MDEPRPRIIAHTAAAERQRRIPKSEGIDPWDADIDGLRLHVEASSCYAVGMRAQELVAPRCSITANDLNLCSGMPHGCVQIGKDVKDARIVVLHLSGAMIAEEI